MGLFKTLFSGQMESSAEKEEKKQKQDFDVLKYDGIRALQAGQTEFAIRCLEKALTLKDDEETTEKLAQAFLQNRETEKAYGILQTLSSQTENPLPVFLIMAKINEQTFNYTRMESLCASALAIYPESGELLYWAGKAQYALGNNLQAIVFLTKAIVHDEQLQSAYLLRASVLLDMGSLKEAEIDADYLLTAFDPTEETLLLKAKICLQTGSIETAILYYNKVISHNPFNEEAYIGLSNAYTINHQTDRALETINEFIELMPESAEAYKERGRIKLQLNDKAGAMDDLKKSLECSPEAMNQLNGRFNNLEQEMNVQYKNRNPYGF